MLGQPYSMEGAVTHGDGRGRNGVIDQQSGQFARVAIKHAEAIDSTRYEAATYRAAIASQLSDQFVRVDGVRGVASIESSA